MVSHPIHKTGADLLLSCLQARGLSAVFGMPGNQNIALYDALARTSPALPHYLVRHEQGASMLASGYIRASGRIAASVTVPGPGAANAATGVLDAYNDNIPLLSIVGGFERICDKRDPSKLFHGLDQKAFYAPFTRYFGSPKRLKEIPRIVNEAFAAMTGVRPGPAVIEIAPDVAAMHLPPGFHPAEPKQRPLALPVNPLELGLAIESIRALRRPVILVGSDVVAADAASLTQRLAELLGAPIIYGRRGKGVISDEHPQVAGFTRSKRTAALLGAADGLIAIGSRFTQIDTKNWTLKLPEVVIQFDRDPKEVGREYPVTRGVSGDLTVALDAVLRELARTHFASDPEWRASAESKHAQWRELPPIPVLSEIRKALPKGGLISVDVTATGYNCFDRFPVEDSRSLIYPCQSVSLGFGFPAAIGAKLACPDRPVVSLSGDGGFLMGAFELGTAVEHEVSVVAVVVKDNCLSAINGSQRKEFNGRTIDTTMRSPDFVALARSFGAEATSTTDIAELPQLIEAGLGRRGPTVIELRMEDRIDEMISVIPWLHGE